jgi:hypothetical protein
VKLELEWISLWLDYRRWAENVGTEERMHREICRWKKICQTGNFRMRNTSLERLSCSILLQDSVLEYAEKIPLPYQGNTREGDAV